MIRDCKVYLEMPESGQQVVSVSATFNSSDDTLAFYRDALALVEKHRRPPDAPVPAAE